MLSKLLFAGPEGLIFDEPTRGIDVAARAPQRSFAHHLTGHLREYGLLFALIAGMLFFQALSTGFVPDIFGMGRPNGTALAAGALAAGAILGLSLRARNRRLQYGIETEPAAFFVLRNLIVTGALLHVAYKLATFRGLPNVLISMAILTVVYAVLTENTVIGRRIDARGGNKKAAKLSGIKTERLTFLAFVNMGLRAAAFFDVHNKSTRG